MTLGQESQSEALRARRKQYVYWIHGETEELIEQALSKDIQHTLRIWGRIDPENQFKGSLPSFFAKLMHNFEASKRTCVALVMPFFLTGYQSFYLKRCGARCSLGGHDYTCKPKRVC